MLILLFSERDKQREVAVQLLKSGNRAAAEKCFQKAVDITPAMAHRLIARIKSMKGGDSVQCIVAPYEADAQLTYLSKTGYVTAVISEDSDLIAFGCKRVRSIRCHFTSLHC